MNYQKIHDYIISRATPRTPQTGFHMHHIIPVHEDTTSTTTVPVTPKEHAILHHLRYKITGTLGNKMAWLFLKGIHKNNINMTEICSAAGKVGGRTTRKLKKGIFSVDYDRGAQSRKNFENGVFDHCDFVSSGKKGGMISRDRQIGIHDLKYKHLRSEWGRMGAAGVHLSGKIGGCCSSEWRDENPQKIKENASNGGKIGGKVVGKLLWWNNGVINKRSMASLGEGWVRGMLMSEKKLKQVMTMLAGHNRKVTYE